MVAPVSSRADFTALSRSRARGRSGPIWVVHVGDHGAGPARVAYAVSKKVGGSVVRNRVRRRLRPMMTELATQHRLPAGAYLVGAGPAVVGLPSADLRRHLIAAVRSSAGVKT